MKKFANLGLSRSRCDLEQSTYESCILCVEKQTSRLICQSKIVPIIWAGQLALPGLLEVSLTGQHVRQLSRQRLVGRISSSGKKEGAANAQGE